MPKTKKYAKRKRTFKKRKATVSVLAKKVNKLYRNVEHKYWEVAGLGALPTNDPTLAIRPYGTVARGTQDYGERIGDKISVNYVRVKSTWEIGTGIAGRKCRVVGIVYKNNPDAVVTPTATIWNLCMESAQANSINVVNCFRDHDNMKSFRVVKDFEFILNPTDAAVPTVRSIDFTIKLPKDCQQVQYVSGGTTISRNELLIFFVQDGDTGVAVNYVTRFNYVDN